MINDFLRYLEYERRFSKHTITSYKTDLHQFEKYWTEVEGDFDWREIQLDHVRSYVVYLLGRHLAARSVNRKIATLRSFFRYLSREGEISENPCKSLKSLKINNRLPSSVLESDLIRLLNEIPRTNELPDSREKLVLELLYGTGMRLSELIGMNEGDFNIADGTVRVLGKGNKVRIIPITLRLKGELEHYLAIKQRTFQLNSKNPLLIRDDGKRCYPMFIQRIVKKHLAGFQSARKKSPHAMRHSFATHLLDRGADLNAVKELLGHSSLAATQVYTHNSMDKLKSIFRKAHPKA